MDAELLKLLGGASLSAALLALIYIVGMRLVRAIDGLGSKIDEHTRTDVEHHDLVRRDLLALQTRMDTVLDLTPIRGVPVIEERRTPPRGVPYGPMRPPTRGER